MILRILRIFFGGRRRQKTAFTQFNKYRFGLIHRQLVLEFGLREAFLPLFPFRGRGSLYPCGSTKQQ